MFGRQSIVRQSNNHASTKLSVCDLITFTKRHAMVTWRHDDNHTFSWKSNDFQQKSFPTATIQRRTKQRKDSVYHCSTEINKNQLFLSFIYLFNKTDITLFRQKTRKDETKKSHRRTTIRASQEKMHDPWHTSVNNLADTNIKVNNPAKNVTARNTKTNGGFKY